MEYSKFKLGSLFSGSGGFELAASLCGIEPVWASEVEPYPIAVTTSRFPKMKHLGNICKINGAEIEPVDIVSFGSPCQGLSVAGLQKGLADERSELFLEAVRIIKEMREATNGRYPTFAVWENVPGAFSSNKCEDFRVVLEELIKIAEPSAVMPSIPQKGWAYADYYCGDGWSLGYRVLDAQYIRTAQRRRRIYLVLDLGGQRARKILFERESLRGYPPQSGTQRQAAPTDAQGSLGADDRARCVISVDQGGGKSGANFHENLSPTLTCTHGGEPAVAYHVPNILLDDQGGQQVNVRTDDVCPTLRAESHGNVPAAVFAVENHPADSRVNIVRRLTPTECARLQGFPDAWSNIDQKDDLTDEEYRFWLGVRNTHAEINGKAVKEYTKQQMLAWYNKLHTDSAEYKMWGNGLALPCALFTMQGIEDALKGE